VGIGLRFDLASFAAWPLVSFSSILFLVAVISKFVGCGLGSYNLGWKDATRIGVGMIPRGEVGMVVAQIGIAFGVISNRMYDAIVFMVITTSLAAPSLLSFAYKKTRDAARECVPIG
jgi:Kef-type K+ transport system membrane component KefB